MELYIGGCGQDKLKTVLDSKKRDKKQTMDAGDVFHGEDVLSGRVFQCRVINHFHLIIKKLPESDIRLFLEELYEKNPGVIIICDEVGNGIVPVEKEERRYREQVGRSCQWLAEKADRVVRIVCGCMQVLKEAPSHLRLYLIRHGETEGNLQKRYVGRTDEPLCDIGRENLKRLQAEAHLPEKPDSMELYVSPMRRCQESAELLFPEIADSCHRIFDFRESDFGAFEYHNYQELMQDGELSPLYQSWIDSGGTMAFPEGERVDSFKERCVRAFRHIMKEGSKAETMVFLVHGGTIMSVLEAYGEPKKGYYDYQVPCADGYVCDYLPGREVITNIVRLRETGREPS